MYNYFMEIWNKLEGFDIDYEISNYGRIKNSKTGRILKLQEEFRKNDGYIKVRCNLIKNNKTVKLTVSRLVLSTFKSIENSEKYHVDHIDFNPTNNRLENLRWLTPEDNNKNKRNIKYYESQLELKDTIIKELKEQLNKLQQL